jgi:hypothetical protein
LEQFFSGVISGDGITMFEGLIRGVILQMALRGSDEIILL